MPVKPKRNRIPKKPRTPYCIFCGARTGKKARQGGLFCSYKCGYMAAFVHYEDWEWDEEKGEWTETNTGED